MHPSLESLAQLLGTPLENGAECPVDHRGARNVLQAALLLGIGFDLKSLHHDPRDRPVAIYGGKTTIHLGGGCNNFLLLPIIPAKAAKAKAGKPAQGAAKSKRRK